MAIRELELIVDEKAILGEGPSWDPEKNSLYWVDIRGMKVHIFDPITNVNRSIQMNQYVGAVVPRQSGGLVLATHHGFFSLNVEDTELAFISHPETHLPNNRFNDGKCDAAGRFCAGTMSMNQEPNAGALYCLETDLSFKRVLHPVTVSNGLTWSPDNKIMYYIDTPTKQVAAFDYDLETGTLRNKRIVVEIPYGMGNPDGMTSDMEGAIWVAHWDGSCVTRWDPFTGKLLEVISLPVSRVTSCVFGGENLEDLYITTARVGLDEQTLSNQPHAGSLFRLKTNVKGVPTFRFGG